MNYNIRRVYKFYWIYLCVYLPIDSTSVQLCSICVQLVCEYLMIERIHFDLSSLKSKPFR